MVRSYKPKTDRAASDRQVRVRYERREKIDAEKVAEVLIRIALRTADSGSTDRHSGTYLRDLLTSQR